MYMWVFAHSRVRTPANLCVFAKDWDGFQWTRPIRHDCDKAQVKAVVVRAVS